MAKRGRPKMDPKDTVVGRAALIAEAKRTLPMGEEELSIYASGAGGLHFCWQAMDHSRGSRNTSSSTSPNSSCACATGRPRAAASSTGASAETSGAPGPASGTVPPRSLLRPGSSHDAGRSPTGQGCSSARGIG